MTTRTRIPTRTPFWKFWNPESGYVGGLIFGGVMFLALQLFLIALGMPL